MNPIPQKLKKELEVDPFMKICVLTCKASCDEIKIDWHHCWKYAGRQINEKWAIIPLWDRKHSPQGDPDSVHRCKETREFVQYLSLKRATKEDLEKYPRNNWDLIFKKLKEKYEKN